LFPLQLFEPGALHCLFYFLIFEMKRGMLSQVWVAILIFFLAFKFIP
jgi:hypothetical protein